MKHKNDHLIVYYQFIIFIFIACGQQKSSVQDVEIRIIQPTLSSSRTLVGEILTGLHKLVFSFNMISIIAAIYYITL